MPTKHSGIKTPSFLHLLVVSLSTLLLYWQSFDDQPVFDAISFLDANALANHYTNYFHRGLFHGLSLVFLSQRGLSIAFISLTAHFFGYSTTLFHVIATILHIINCTLFYMFFSQGLRDFSNSSKSSSSNHYVFFCTLLIALHPAAVYACAYTAQITILLATFWTLIFALCFFRLFNKPKTSLLVVLIFIYILIIQSKETAIMVPFAFLPLLLCDQFRSKPKSHLIILFTACFVIAGFYTLQSSHLLGQTYEAWSGRMQLISNPQATDAGRPASLQGHHTYIRSVLNQMFLFGRYSFTWLLPLPRFLAIDIPTVFPRHLFTPTNMIGFVGFFTYPIVFLILHHRRRISTFQLFSLLFPWICFFTEFAVVRFHESYVLYRSYLWMPMALLGTLQFIPQRHRDSITLKFSLIALILILATLSHFRIKTFENHIAVWQDAVDKINIADKTNTSAYRAFLFLGGLQVLEGNHAAGINNIKTAITFDDSAYLSHYNLGLAYLQTSQFQEATNEFKRANELAPQDQPSLYNLGNALFYSKNLDEAIATFNRLLELEPNHADGHHNLAIAYSQKGDLAQSIAHYQKVLAINPDHKKVHYNFGNALMLNGQPTEAIVQYTAALKHDPNSYITHYNLALAYLKTNDRTNAAQHFKTVIQLNPQFTPAQKILKSLETATPTNSTPQ